MTASDEGEFHDLLTAKASVPAHVVFRAFAQETVALYRQLLG